MMRQEALGIASRALPTAAAPHTGTNSWHADKRIGGLARFATAITVLNVAGHLFLGFEQSWLTPFVALATSYTVDLLGETVEAATTGRRARYRGSLAQLVRFLLPAHISGLAVAMLLYASEQLWAVAFAASVAISSKYLFRVRFGSDRAGQPFLRHVLNPSNFGIAVTLLLFPTVGIAQPYQFMENTSGLADWLIPLFVIVLGSLLNTLFTGRVPLIIAWVGGFAAQAILRAAVNGTPWFAGLFPMTGFAFILFTFYMVTDPATTPARRRDQILFGLAVAVAYALLMELHVVFGLFFALVIVSGGRGFLLALANLARQSGGPDQAFVGSPSARGLRSTLRQVLRFSRPNGTPVP